MEWHVSSTGWRTLRRLVHVVVVGGLRAVGMLLLLDLEVARGELRRRTRQWLLPSMDTLQPWGTILLRRKTGFLVIAGCSG